MTGRLIAKMFILLIILTRLFGAWSGQLVPFLLFVLIPFLAVIVMQARRAQDCYEEYVDEIEKDNKRFLEIVYFDGNRITKSYLKRFTPFVEGMYIKMIKHGIHSIHAVPRLLCD